MTYSDAPYDVLLVAMDCVNERLPIDEPATIYMKINDNFIPRQVIGRAYIEDDAVWLNLEPLQGYPNRVRTRIMYWSKPRDL